MSALAPSDLRDIETFAVDLAHVAGAEAAAMFAQTLTLRRKEDGSAVREVGMDPVMAADRNIELMIRARLADRFPGHRILGEEVAEPRDGVPGIAWVLDIIDGVTNFVNGFPLFAASIGVLSDGEPVAGAVWCATTHALRPGVYHARRGGPLCFDNEDLAPGAGLGLARALAGDGAGGGPPWASRRTGATAVECAFTAAGLLQVAQFQAPSLWDVAGGIPLVLAAGGLICVGTPEGQWQRFTRFDGDLGIWRRPMVLGETEAVLARCGLDTVPPS